LLGISETIVQPNFAASFIFELRQDRGGKHYVRVLNKNQPYPGDIEFVPVTIKGNVIWVYFNQRTLKKNYHFYNILKGCDTLCPLDQFLALANRPEKVLRPDQVVSACRTL